MKSIIRTVALLLVTACCSSVLATVHDLAADFDQDLISNPDGVWTYGYMTSDLGTFINDEFIQTSSSGGFVAFDTTGSAGGIGTGWRSSTFGFPQGGVLNVPPNPTAVAPFPSLTDFPSAEGDNPAYPNGVLGGHSPSCTFCTGWYAVKYTAGSSGPVDIDLQSWQTAIYPATLPLGADPLFGGNTRPHQVLIQKDNGSTTDLLRTPMVSRHGWTNRTGDPEYTAQNAPTPGNPASFDAQQDEIDAAMASSAAPNVQRLTGVNLNAGESLIISFAPYFNNGPPTGGTVQSGFLGFNAVVRDGADRVDTTRWDLSQDWSVVGGSASRIGPDAAWSYGILEGGSFAAYDKIMFGQEPDDENLPRENHGWGSNAPGWFVSSAAEPEEGPVVPGMVRDYDGFNITKVQEGGVVTEVNGDWSGGDVALHTPSPDVDAAQTSVIRWTAPRNMTVDANGDMWRLTLPDDTDRRHQFDLLHNGSSIASGTIEELGFDCNGGDTNSACPEAFAVAGISVQDGDTLDLQISPVSGGGAAPGDYNNNGVVDAADYAVWLANLGASTLTNRDPNATGDVGLDDYEFWKDNLTNTGGGGSSASPGFVGVNFTVAESTGSGSSSANVPEPATCLLLCLAVLFLPTRRDH